MSALFSCSVLRCSSLSVKGNFVTFIEIVFFKLIVFRNKSDLLFTAEAEFNGDIVAFISCASGQI